MLALIKLGIYHHILPCSWRNNSKAQALMYDIQSNPLKCIERMLRGNEHNEKASRSLPLGNGNLVILLKFSERFDPQVCD